MKTLIEVTLSSMDHLAPFVHHINFTRIRPRPDCQLLSDDAASWLNPVLTGCTIAVVSYLSCNLPDRKSVV